MHEKIGSGDNHLGVNRGFLAGFQNNRREFGYDHHEHEPHNYKKGKNDENRINQGVPGFGSQRVLPVQIFRQVEKSLIELAGFFAGFDQIDIKGGEYRWVLG